MALLRLSRALHLPYVAPSAAATAADEKGDKKKTEKKGAGKGDKPAVTEGAAGVAAKGRPLWNSHLAALQVCRRCAPACRRSRVFPAQTRMELRTSQREPDTAVSVLVALTEQALSSRNAVLRSKVLLRALDEVAKTPADSVRITRLSR